MSGAIFSGREGKNRNRVEKVQIRRHFAGRSEVDEDSDDNASDEDDLVHSVKKKKKRVKKISKDAMVIKRGNTSTTIIRRPPPPTKKESINIRLLPPPTIRNTSNIVPVKEEEESDSDSDDSDSDDSDSDSDGEDILSSFTNSRMSFVPKSSRKNVVKTKEEIQEEEEKKRIEKLENMKRRKEETQMKLLKILIDEEKRAEDDDEEIEDEELLLADDEDDDEDEQEYELWMEREKQRIIRYKTERYQIEREREEIHRLRNLGEKEREELDRKLTLKNQLLQEEEDRKKREGKGSFQFMQRFYKKGVFFQGEDEEGKEDSIHERDFQAPTMQDKTNYKMLPKILQNKYFGMKGNVKWTHLSKEDTTDWDSPWFVKGKDKYSGKKRGRSSDNISFDSKRKRRKR